VRDWRLEIMPILIAIAITAILVFSMGGCCKCEDAPEAAAAEAAEAPVEEEAEEAPAEETKEAEEAKEGGDDE